MQRVLLCAFLSLTGLSIACGDSDPSDGTPPADAGVSSPEPDAGASTTDAGMESMDSGPIDTGGRRPQVSEVDPDCVDGLYTEIEIPDPSVDIDAQIGTYNDVSSAEFIQAILEPRYPWGAELVRRGLPYDGNFQCVDDFANRTGPQEFIHSVAKVVHECGHALAYLNQTPTTWTFTLNDQVSFACENGHLIDEGGMTFARGLIDGDAYASLRPPCGLQSSPDCDFFHPVYIAGQAGQEGFDALLEETVQYINSLATAYAIHDWYSLNINHLDGLLTTLWYVERYLKLAREQYPDVYRLLSEDPCWRRAILSTWGRAFLYLEVSDGIREVGLYQIEIIRLVRDPDLLNEIELLRRAEGCPE